MKVNEMKMAKRLLCLMLLLSLTACTSWKSVQIDRAPDKLKRGDKIMLKMKDGPNRTVKVKQANAMEIIDSRGRHYDYRDMRGISRKQVSVVKTGTSVVGTTASVSAFAASTAISVVLPLLGLGLSLAILL